MSWRFGLVSILLLCLPATAFGQVAITGKITGVVTDSSGAAIPNATVTVRGIALMAVRTTATQPDGSYLFDLLPVGTYDITVAAPGFTTYLQKGVQISAGFTATVNARLHVGEVSAVVTVTGEDPVVDVKSSATPATFDQNLLQDIPSGRDPWSTVAQAPGTTLSTFDVGGNQSFQQSTMQVHGSKPGEQVYSFNGLRLNWPGSSGGFTAFYIDHDSLQEFQVVTDAAPAEVSVGGIYMNLVTKSGSNQFHGLAATYYTTSALQSDINLPTFKGAPVNAGTPLVMARDTTANAGGPLLRDRWWIFGAYRRYDIREDVLAVRRGPNGPPIQDINHQSDTVLRSDFQINPKNRVNVQWLYNNQNRFFRRDTAFNFVDDTASWRQIEPAYIVQGQWTSVVTNNFIVDARLGYLHLLFPLAYQPTVKPTDINLQDVTLSTEKGAAPSNFLNPAQTLRFAASASYYKGAFLGGAHNFKFGYEVGTNRNGNNTDVNGDIRAIFNNDTPFRVTVLNTPIRERSIFHDSAFFVQDAWSLPRHVTLNVGFRFDHFRTFNPPQSSPGSGTFTSLFPGRSLAQTQEVAEWNNVAPRLGVAFDLTGRGKSVLRAGYNRFYLIEGTELAEAVNPNTLAGKTFVWNDVDNDRIPQPNEFLSNPQVDSFGGVFTRIDPQLERPYSDQVNVGYEQQVYRDLHVGVSYFYRVNKRQISRRNMAILPSGYSPVVSSTGNPFTNPLTGQPVTLFSVINPTALRGPDFLVTNIPALDDNAYHGVEFTAIKRFSNKWQLLAGFTIQRAKGVFSSRLNDDFNNPNRDINRRDSNLDFDSTYVFKLDGTYNLPYGFVTSINFQHYTGYPVQPRNVFVSTALSQQSETVILQPRGQFRLPNLDLLNLRISRPFNFREDRYKVEPIVDLLNLTNNNAVVSEVELFGLRYLRPSNVLNPFVARFGMRMTF